METEMRLATLKDGSRDGRLAVVSKDLARAAFAPEPFRTLQLALEHWDQAAPALEATPADAFPFDPAQAMAPLPRAFQWLDASAFLSHGLLMMKAFNLKENPQGEQPLIYQGASDDFLGAREDAPFPREEDGIDFEGEFGAILGDVPMGVSPEEAESHIHLLVQLNDWSLRALAPREMKTGFGFLQAKPSTAFAPVAVTPGELGSAWRDGRIDLPLQVWWNGNKFGAPRGGEMNFRFGALIAHAASTRRLRAGTIIGTGTVSNSGAAEVGSACISERRALDMIAGRTPTAFMRFGDRVVMEALDQKGFPLFGRIEQRVVRTG
jgi:fumarylacetoacetate (FAA) hydrolase